MNQFKSTNNSPPIYRGEAPSAANTTDETNKAKSPALDPTHALLHLPTLFHVPVATGEAQEQANKWVVLMLVALAAFMTTLDSSIVNIGLPAIAHTFGVGVSGAIEWIIIGYLIVIAACLLTLGRLADMVGRKPIFEAGLVIFVLGSIFSGAAPSLATLIIARLFQGVGGAFIFAVNTAMITSVFPASERGRALGLNAVVVALGVSAGPTIGGLITQYLSWRWIFYVNVPIGVLVFSMGMRMLTEPLHRNKQRFDPVGAVLLAIGLASMTLGFSFGQEWGWTSPGIISSLVVGVVALVAAVVVERRVPDPILNLLLLKNRVFASANISFVLAMLALFAPGFLLPFYFEELRGFPAVQAGLLLTPLSLTLAVVGPLRGALAGPFWPRPPPPPGASHPRFGAAAAGVLLSSQGQNLSTSGVSALQNTFLAGFHAAFIVCAAFAAIGIFTSLIRGNEHKHRQTQPEAQR